MAWLLIAQSEAPAPILPESSAWDWLLPVGVVLVAVALMVSLAIYVVRSRRLATLALAGVEQICGSHGDRVDTPA